MALWVRKPALGRIKRLNIRWTKNCLTASVWLLSRQWARQSPLRSHFFPAFCNLLLTSSKSKSIPTVPTLSKDLGSFLKFWWGPQGWQQLKTKNLMLSRSRSSSSKPKRSGIADLNCWYLFPPEGSLLMPAVGWTGACQSGIFHKR